MLKMLTPVFAWLFGASFLPWLVRTVLQILCGLGAYAGFTSFVLPSFFSISVIYGLFNGLPQGVLYLLSVAAVPQGIALILSAYIAAIVMNKIAEACKSFTASSAPPSP